MGSKNVPERSTLPVMSRLVSLGEILRRARGSRSLREMARQTGLAVNTVRLLEADETALPSRDTLLLLAAAYGVAQDVLARAAYGTYFEKVEGALHPVVEASGVS